MKFHEVLEKMTECTMIRRKNWRGYLIRHSSTHYPFLEVDLFREQLTKYIFSYNDLMADDWEIID
jgi:hypothetical protein